VLKYFLCETPPIAAGTALADRLFVPMAEIINGLQYKVANGGIFRRSNPRDFAESGKPPGDGERVGLTIEIRFRRERDVSIAARTVPVCHPAAACLHNGRDRANPQV
jgi:hypothetical protein